MAKLECDRLVAWELDHLARIIGFQGKNAYYSFGLVTRWLLPALDQDFAKPGDLLFLARGSFLTAQDVGALGNGTRETVLNASRPRALLVVALLAALGSGLLYRFGAPPMLVSSPAVLALVAFGRLLDAGKAAEQFVARRKAERRAFMRRYMAPPRPPPSPAQQVARLAAAYAEQVPEIRWEQIASLDLPDGRLVAGDAYSLGEGEGELIEVPPGTYQVRLGIARLRQEQMLWGDERIAYAALRLSDRPAASWEALGMDVGIDSATASFVSASARAKLAAAFGPDPETALQPINERGWAALEIPGAQLVAFGSGFGDGFYPVYRGLDAEGRPVAIALDFKAF